MKIKRYIQILFFTLFSFSCDAAIYSFEEALENSQKLGLKMPRPEEDGRVQTMNRMGAQSPANDEATREFIASSDGKDILEVGAAYGRVMLEVMSSKNPRSYDVCDLYKRHLFLAADNLSKLSINDNKKNLVRFIEADITASFNWGKKYDSVLVSRVLHFFTPEKLSSSVKNISSLLKKGGKVYVVAITPYVKRYESFIEEYERRLRAGEEFPGFVNSLADWMNKDVTPLSQQAAITNEPFMFLDDKILRKLFVKHGFKVNNLKLKPLEYKSASWALDGRENVIMIAEKL